MEVRMQCKGCGRTLFVKRDADTFSFDHEAPLCEAIKDVIAALPPPERIEYPVRCTDCGLPPGKCAC